MTFFKHRCAWISRDCLTACALIFTTNICVAEEERSLGISIYPHPNAWLEELKVDTVKVAVAMDEEWQELETRWGVASDQIRYNGPAPLNLRIAAFPESEAQTATINPPASAESIILFVFPVSEDRVELFPLNNSEDVLPDGHVHFFNLSREEVALNINGETQGVEPGETWSRPAEGDVAIQLQAQVAARHKERWRLVYRGNYVLKPDANTIMLVHRRDLTEGPWTVTRFAQPKRDSVQVEENK